MTRAAERYPDRPAWIDARRAVTFKEAADRVRRLGQALASLGGQPGDRVGLLMPNCPEGLEAILAPIQAGMAAVPMNIRLHPDEHAYMLNDSGAFALIAGAESRPHVSRMRERLETVKHFYPREIEEAICPHPSVFEVSVIGVPDDKWGEAVKALVVVRPGESATEAAIIEHCQRHLASYEKPRSVEFLPVLPQNAYIKVLKRELRDRYWVDRRR